MLRLPPRLVGLSLAIVTSLGSLAASADPLHPALALVQPERLTVAVPAEPSAEVESLPVVEASIAVAESVEAPDDEMVKEDSHRKSSLSIGEGGRDLVPRLRWVHSGSLNPFVSLELYGDAGPKPTLLGVESTYVRINPLVAAGFSPTADLTVYTGVGPGGAVIGASSEHVAAHTVEEEVALTGAALIGARWTGDAFPMMFEWRTEAVAERGFASMLSFTMEIAQ